MNRPIPKLGSVKNPKQLSEQFFKSFTHIALPLISEEGDLRVDKSKKEIKSLEQIFNISFANEIKKHGAGITGKAGELIDIPVLEDEVKRIILVAVGNRSETEIRKAATALGRKVRASKSKLISLLAENDTEAQVHYLGTALATYSWSQKSSPKPDTPEINLLGDFAPVCERSAVLLEATWKARDLIHTPSNIKSPSWMAEQAKKFAKNSAVSVKVKSGKELSEFGGLRAVGNSSQKNPPRFVEVSYKPRGVKNPLHVVLVGKGITFDTGGVSLKRPYDTMTAMKSDMSGAAAVLMTTIAAAELKLPVRVTALLMLAENALSGTSQRPSDVITHYGGTTVEVINTDAEGRLVLADGLAYADKNLDPDYLIDVATLTGAATLGLSRFYGAMYTRDKKLANQLSSLSDFTGDRIWHMPLVDDYDVALASDIADYNHTADKFKFQGGSVTAALFLEKFVGKGKWAHLDIAGPARSEVDAGENVKGGTGYGVRLLTEWIAGL
ncbi:MAG: leucyl aminopeptidase family protein [Candidatus Nanopelagicaceae bacterium]